MLVVCDLDRTLIPNGQESYSGSLPKFYEMIDERPEITLAYATGRNLELFKLAETEFGIKKPDFLLGSVGTEVFKQEAGEMVPELDWYKYLEVQHANWSRDDLVQDLTGSFEENILWLQEDNVQNKYKVSYYLKDENYRSVVVEVMEKYLNQNNVEAEVVYSFDPHKNLGLIDVLPVKATKLGALEFLISKLNKDKEEVVYSGDSGNDLLPLTAGIKAVLVNNARDEVKEEALKIVKERSYEDKLYISKGNYADGVIEGLKYFGVFR